MQYILNMEDKIQKFVCQRFQFDLRPFQLAAISNIVLKKKDTFVAVPTGMGKTMCYALLPTIVDHLHPKSTPSSIIVISPLLALMEDQVTQLRSLGVKATHLGSSQLDKTVLSQVLEGNFQVVLMSPEGAMGRMRKLFLKMRASLAAVVIDEAHCIQSWSDDDFRPAFKDLGRLRAVVSAPYMALTATATQAIIDNVTSALLMDDTAIIHIPANRSNISYKVVNICASDMTMFDPVIDLLNNSSLVCPKVIVYCSVIDVVSSVFMYFRQRVPHPCTMLCPVAMFHKSTAPENKLHVMSEFSRPESTIRVVVASVAFGLGVNIKDVKTVINYGVPLTLEEFVQESGRAGRNGDDAESTLYHCSALQRRGTDVAMLDYCSKDVGCRRSYIAQYFKLSNVSEFAAPDAKSVSPCCDLCSTN